MQLLGDDIDGNAILVVEIRERHQDHPLRSADSKRLGPEVAQLFQVHADRIDHPGEPPDGFLVLWSCFAQSTSLACTEGACNPSTLFTLDQIFVDFICKT